MKAPMAASPENADVILEARGVSMQYPGTLALDDVTFRLRRGRVSALIGENGAGKSTLVKILAGIVQPTRGRLLLDGTEISLESVRDADALGIGIIHQELNLCPNLSVAENIFLGARVDGARSARQAPRRGSHARAAGPDANSPSTPGRSSESCRLDSSRSSRSPKPWRAMSAS